MKNSWNYLRQSLQSAFLIILFCVLSFTITANKPVDLIVFAYDRPLQLYALLESVAVHMQGLNSVSVLLRTSNDSYKNSYHVVKNAFPTVAFIEQVNPPSDFQPLLMEIVNSRKADYLMFAVDDNVVKDTVDLSDCVKALQETGAYGFYLRLGDHTDYCHGRNSHQGIPDLVAVRDNIVKWRFKAGNFDWNYPNTVDMTIYPKKRIQQVVTLLKYTSPGTFEVLWDMCANPIRDLYGLCYRKSKILGLPFNLVQSEFPMSRITANYTAQQLLEIFKQGLKLDITKLYHIENNGAHVDHNPFFVRRDNMVYTIN